MAADVGQRYGELIAVDVIPFAAGTGGLYERFGLRDAGYYLVRPDGYVAYRSASLNGHGLTEYLHGILAPSRSATTGRPDV
jgi:hypothetical protein